MSLRSFMLLMFLVAHVPGVRAANTDTPLRVQGSTTFYSEILVPFQKTIEASYGRSFDVVANKSSWGLLSLFEGRCDVAMISAPLSAEVISANKTMSQFPYGDLREHRIGATRTAFAIHPSNGATRLTLDQVASILKGDVTNWKDVGGRDLPILVVSVKEGGGTVAAVRAMVLGDAPMPITAVRLESANHVLKVVSQEPGALGIAQLGLIRRAKLPEIVTDRVVEQPLSFVTLGEPSPGVARLIAITRDIVARNRD